jgi:hypothetical protein
LQLPSLPALLRRLVDDRCRLQLHPLRQRHAPVVGVCVCASVYLFCVPLCQRCMQGVSCTMFCVCSVACVMLARVC